MSPRTRTVTFLATFLLITGPVSTLFAQKGVIAAEDSRAALISKVENILQPASDEFDLRLESVPTPFVERATAVEKTTQSEPVTRVVEARQLPDEVALDAVLRSFRPSGSMIGPKSSYLNLGNGQVVRLGDSFNANIQGRNYAVTVAEITPDGYTLAVGKARGSRTFLENRLGSGATIERGGALPTDDPDVPVDDEENPFD